jgi:uncharacterized membrane protein
MKNRTFFMVKGIEAAKTMVADIRSLGVEDEDLHVIADHSITLEPLPEPDLAHRSDLINAARRGALTGGAMGLVGGVIAVTVPAVGLTLGGGAVLAGTALGTALGTWFSTLVGVSVPNQDVEEYRQRIESGEVMIIVDLDEDTQRQFTTTMAERHPDIVLEFGNLDAA